MEIVPVRHELTVLNFLNGLIQCYIAFCITLLLEKFTQSIIHYYCLTIVMLFVIAALYKYCYR
jgi:hypothetical protein